MGLKLTKKQLALLEFLENFTAENNYSPSYREIMSGMGLSSVSAVAEHIDNLVNKGVLKKVPGAARSLEILDYKHEETVELFKAKLIDCNEEEKNILNKAGKILCLDLEKNLKNFKKKIIFLEWVLFVCIIGLIIGFWIIWQQNLEKKENNLFPDRGIPRINIDLNGIEADVIKNNNKEIKYDGNKIKIFDGDNQTSYYDVVLKGRGNGTWVQEKKPFQIKFQDKIDLFGMGKSRKWYLLANNLDSTHLRNKIAIEIEKMLGMTFVIDGRFIELYLNGEYEGLYYMTPAVEIGKNSVDLRDENSILVELDNIYGAMEEYYQTSNGDYLTIKDMKNWDNKDLVMADFLNSYNSLELAISRKDYIEIQSLINVDSWAKYYLLSEFIVNPDAYWTSFYMYKDGLNDKIHAGPGWDFDLAFANKKWGNWMGSRYYSPTETMIRKQELLLRDDENVFLSESEYAWSEPLSTIVFDLMEIPEFRGKVEEIYQQYLSGKENELIQQIMINANYISENADIDNKKWGKADFGDDLKSIVDWVNRRYDYFEVEYGAAL